MTSESDAERLIRAALQIASERGWRTVTFVEIAERAEIPLVDAYAAFPGKPALLCGLIAFVDRAVLADGAAEAADTPRDRLFEILMRRFDVLQAHRGGMLAILRDLRWDAPTVLPALPRFAASMGWMLEAAGLSASGISGSLRVKGLSLVYLDALRTWAADDSADMTRTMAALDKGLRRAEQVARSLPRPLRREVTADDRASPPPPAANPVPAAD